MTWLDRLKKLELPAPSTDKTDKTPSHRLLSVLSVAYPSASEESQATGHRLRVVEFRLTSDAQGRWHTALGPDLEKLVLDLRDRFGDRLAGIRQSRKPDVKAIGT